MKHLALIFIFIPSFSLASIDEAKHFLKIGKPDEALQLLLLEDRSLEVEKLIGNCYAIAGDYDQAETIYRNLLQNAKAEDDLKFQGFACNNLANIKFEQEDFESSLFLYQKALSIKRKLQDPSIIKTLTGISTSYYMLGDVTSALRSQKEALSFMAADSVELSKAYNNLGRYYMELSNDSSEHFLSLALNTSITPYDSMQAHHNLAKFYDVGSTGKALDHYKQYVKIKEYIFSLELMEKMTELQEQHKAELKEKQQAFDDKVAIITTSVGGGFGLIILFAAASKILDKKGRVKVRLFLAERVGILLDDDAKFFYSGYQKPAPAPIETKIFNIIKLIHRKSMDGDVFCNLNSDGQKLEVIFNVTGTEILDVDMVQPQLLADEAKIHLRYQVRNKNLNVYMEWPQ